MQDAQFDIIIDIVRMDALGGINAEISAQLPRGLAKHSEIGVPIRAADKMFLDDRIIIRPGRPETKADTAFSCGLS